MEPKLLFRLEVNLIGSFAISIGQVDRIMHHTKSYRCILIIGIVNSISFDSNPDQFAGFINPDALQHGFGLGIFWPF